MDASTIEQMNKLRRSLGLPLLSAPGVPSADAGPKFREHSASDDSDEEQASTLETREAAGFSNYKQLQDEDKKRLERERRKQAIQKARDAAARFGKLEGKGLGDVADGADGNAKAWLRGQKKRQAKIDRERAQRLADELAERERLAAIEYTSSDLAGVQVAHELGDFENGDSEQILTLQDAQIGGDDDSEQEDVLENTNIAARDKLKEKLDLKKRKAYDVNADDSGAVLSQYDDKKRKAFTLDGQGATIEERETKKQQIGQMLKVGISLDILKSEPVSDYMEIKMKKPRKSKKTSLRQRHNEDDEDLTPDHARANEDVMQVDNIQQDVKSQPHAGATSVYDDEDLATALSLSRRAALKKQKRRPEDIVRQLKDEADAKPDTGLEGGLTLDDTTNFLDNLRGRPREEQRQAVVHQSVEDGAEAGSPDSAEPDHEMQEAYSITDNAQDLLDRLRREQSAHTPEISHSGLTEEQTLDQGMGATLNLLKQRGLVKGEEAGGKNTLYRDRQKFIIEARLREHDNEQKARLQRERDRQSGKMSHMSVKEREEHARWQNTQREHQGSIQAAASFNREYKPDVQLKYVDEDGRLMNQKEAFKHLSHQFHGKGSGKQKTEKHLKKVADEKRRDAASVLDSSKARGLDNAMGTTAKKNKEAGVRMA